MTVFIHAWEHSLVSLAKSAAQQMGEVVHPVGMPADPMLLMHAYAHCAQLTAVHSRSFHLASGLLPPDKRRAVRALYAFCRITDDLVDNPNPEAQRDLEQWREQALSFTPPADQLVALAWADTRRRYHIPPHYVEQLISGVARDFFQLRYQTFEELAAYAYGVASTVGLMSMHIVGFASQEAIPYAVKLGVALQLTNILRDIGEDWQRGRLYLPQEELAAFGLAEEELEAERLSDNWRELMRFQIIRNRQLYQEALPGIGLLHPDGRFAIGAAAELYRAILDDIEANNYDVFHYRAHTSGWGKLRRLPGIWWRSHHYSKRPNVLQ
jgi:phytoene synthase